MGIKIPIIAFTAASKVEVFEAVFAAGMNDIIFKPIENNSFIQTIENHLNK
jgi:PleD family two-component response regulator